MPEWKSDRNEAIRESRRLLANKDLRILDTETTGLDAKAEVCEIAVIGRNEQVLVDTLLRPRVPIPQDVTAIHGITDAHVLSAEPAGDFIPRVLEKLLQDDKPLAIFNAPFDLRMLDQSTDGERAWRERGNTFCIMDMYSRFYGDSNDYRGNYTWQSLANAASQSGLDWEGPSHRALADTLMALAVLRHIAAFSET